MSKHIRHEENVIQGMQIVSREDRENTGGWIPIVYGMDESNTPPEEKDILLSFSNFSLPAVGHYTDGAFYVGDDDNPIASYGVFVNAWMPLPEPFKEDTDD